MEALGKPFSSEHAEILFIWLDFLFIEPRLE
jgi:hypothetical protein